MHEQNYIGITVNGVPSECPASRHLLDYLHDKNLATDRVVVEKNGAIVPVEEYALATLQDGDMLEIIHFVGGG